MITRRGFIAGGAASVLTHPRILVAQQAQLRRLALFHPSRPVAEMNEGSNTEIAAFFQELRRLGHIEGQNIAIERWSGDGDAARYESQMAAMVATQPDVILSPGGTQLTIQLSRLTERIPVVYMGGDPVAAGLAESLARPGGNVTGLVALPDNVSGKLLQLLHEAIPGARRVGFPGPRRAFESPGSRQVFEAAAGFGVTLVPYAIEGPIDEAAYREAFAAMTRDGIEALYVAGATENITFAPFLGELAFAARLPGIFNRREFAEHGGLLAYGPSTRDLLRRAAGYVDRILKGSNPAEMPIEQPTKFDFVINLKTARALGITLPASILYFATEIIE
jgi:putative ABC transport system substrate-binding protein